MQASERMVTVRISYKKRNGFLLLYKRVESGHFTWPRSSNDLRSLSAEQFQWLMQGFAIDPVIHDITPDNST